MAKYSKQDLEYASKLREEVHNEALSIVRKTNPNIEEVIDFHPVEDYFQELWDYPGKCYTVVAIPYGYKNRKAFVEKIVSDTLLDNETNNEFKTINIDDTSMQNEEPLNQLLAKYPDLVIDCNFVYDNNHDYQSHLNALKDTLDKLSIWKFNIELAKGEKISSQELFSLEHKKEELNYRSAFLNPPHRNYYNNKDFMDFNRELFPNGIDDLEVFKWNTDWSDYFDDGHEWWGALCLTIYDKSLSRFIIIMASATD